MILLFSLKSFVNFSKISNCYFNFKGEKKNNEKPFSGIMITGKLSIEGKKTDVFNYGVIKVEKGKDRWWHLVEITSLE